MKQLEGVRLEVDSRRRTVLGLNSTLEKQRVRLPETKAKGEVKLEQVVKKMQHKENKLAGISFAGDAVNFYLFEREFV